jgi:hypothetical protein
MVLATFRTLCALFVLMAWAAPAVAAAVRAAVFDFELIDTSLEAAAGAPRPVEGGRLKQASDQLRRRLEESGRFALVDIAPVAERARASNLQACGGCDVDLARELGADLSITGTVQKVSNLILNMNIYLRDVRSGELVSATSADFRGNTDESWQRALDWLVRNRLLAPDDGARR